MEEDKRSGLLEALMNIEPIKAADCQMDIIYTNGPAGACPVQAEGTINGNPFYFRSRGSQWSLSIGKDPVMDPEWEHKELYGSGPFDAGWIPEEEAKALIAYAAWKWLRETEEYKRT